MGASLRLPPLLLFPLDRSEDTAPREGDKSRDDEDHPEIEADGEGAEAHHERGEEVDGFRFHSLPFGLRDFLCRTKIVARNNARHKTAKNPPTAFWFVICCCSFLTDVRPRPFVTRLYSAGDAGSTEPLTGFRAFA